MTDNLPELRDIHLPVDGVSFWPLAGGWWCVLISLLIILILFKTLKWLRRKSAKLYAEHILKSIENQTDLSAAIKISEILRRACIRKYPSAVALSGKEWIDFLNEHSHQKIDKTLADLLQNVPFMPEETSHIEPRQIKRLWQFCYAWIGENL